MEPITIHSGIVASIDRANIDTDAIIPKQFLKRIERTGFGQFLFFDWRFLDDGAPNPEFVLNRPEYAGASVLLARRNFGCGSSREHAPWALEDYGFRVILAPSFADIFYNNCFKNGILPVELAPAVVDQLFQEMYENEGYSLVVDLSSQRVETPTGETISFAVDEFRKHCLLNGLDDIGLTLQKSDAIDAFEKEYSVATPWV